MSSTLLLAALLLPAVARADPAPVPFAVPTAPDPGTVFAGKYLHVLAGMAVGLATAGTLEASLPPSVASQQPLLLPVLALAGAAVAGTAKEILDSTGFGDPRITDVFITTAGGALAAGAVYYAQSAYPATAQGRTNSAAVLLTSAALLAVPVVIGFIGEIRRAVERRAASQGGTRGATER